MKNKLTLILTTLPSLLGVRFRSEVEIAFSISFKTALSKGSTTIVCAPEVETLATFSVLLSKFREESIEEIDCYNNNVECYLNYGTITDYFTCANGVGTSK